MTLLIRRFETEDWGRLLQLILDEGDEWADYTDTAGQPAYLSAVKDSETFLAFENEQVVGFCRCRLDGVFGVYIYDLLVDKAFRGRKIAQRLMEEVCLAYPKQIVYVMSDVDEFYESKGYRKEGSIFEVRISES